MTGPAERLYGCGSLDAAFSGEHLVVPWPAAGRKKAEVLIKPRQLTALLGGPPTLAHVDPRVLHASQTWVVATHTAYYLTGTWERTGTTSADRIASHNRYPLVHVDAEGRHIILAGHHRSMAALIQGRPVLARVVRTDRHQATPVLPLLHVGAGSPLAEVITSDHAAAAATITSGQITFVPDMATAEQTMRTLGLTDELIDDRLAMATTGRCRAAI